MICSADGCERQATYKEKGLCQKHYFRVWRNGSTELKPKTRKNRIVTPNGYIRVWAPDHPLANRRYVFEHRKVMFDIVGPECGPCELCGREQSWAICHVDHIDDDRKNNDPKNLRILCRGCNVKRGMNVESHKNRGRVGLIEHGGRLDTPKGWSKDPKVKVSGSTIIRRKLSGMSDYDALFSEKKTHNGRSK